MHAGGQCRFERLHNQFLSSHGLPSLPRPGCLPPWADMEFVYQIVPHQVRRDIEQLEYLVSNDVLSPELRQYVIDLALPDYRRMLVAARIALSGREDAYILTHPQQEFAVFFGLHRRALHMHPGGAVKGDAISRRLDLDMVQDDYLQKDHRVIVIDNFFSEDALQQLHDFLLESSIWTKAKFGYVGAYLDNGFACPLISQIDHELRSRLPRVLGGLELQNAWAYMYDGSLGGVGTHADDAQIQINFFITPTEANLWSNSSSYPSGGLVIYGVGPPPEWGYDMYNNAIENPEVRDVLASIDYRNLTVPYMQNRAIMFDSTYFHQSDSMKFRKGYKNRRINVTFLYGKRSDLKPMPAVMPSAKPASADFHAQHIEEGKTISASMGHFYQEGELWLDDED